MRILFLGDIFGRPGRMAVKHWLPDFRQQAGVDIVIANGENASGGKGITGTCADELFHMGVDVLTGGNHSFHHREAAALFDGDERLLRPANLPPGTPGHGLGFYTTASGVKVAVLNLMGRAFMKPIDCPFRAAEALAAEALRQTPVLIVDFHAEATSEKVGMAAWLDGKATAVIGTHTHIPTADARVTPAGTAVITDVGMTGPYASIIGVETGIVLDQLIKVMPVRHEVAHDDARVSALLIDADPRTGRAAKAELIQHPGWPSERP